MATLKNPAKLMFFPCLTASLVGACAPRQSAAAKAAPGGVPILTARISSVLDHDKNSFTEGLFTADGLVYESSGLEGKSQIRAYDQHSGKSARTSPSLGSGLFGEGVAPVAVTSGNPRLYQLTWRGHKGFIYDRTSFAPVDTFSYAGEGWGLAAVPETFCQGLKPCPNLVMSDGTSQLRFISATPAEPFKELSRISVTEGGQPLTQLNELEWVDGKIYANVWKDARLVIIDPATGLVLASVDAAAITAAGQQAMSDSGTKPSLDDCLNGIAYDAASRTLLITGKSWPKMYEIELPK